MTTTFQIGDRVRLVEDHPDDQAFGCAGDTGTITDIKADPEYINEAIEVEIDGGDVWWQPERILRKIDTEHTDADLAMALMLAKLVRYSDYDFRHADAEVADWLHDEVTNALLARGAR